MLPWTSSPLGISFNGTYGDGVITLVLAAALGGLALALPRRWWNAIRARGLFAIALVEIVAACGSGASSSIASFSGKGEETQGDNPSVHDVVTVSTEGDYKVDFNFSQNSGGQNCGYSIFLVDDVGGRALTVAQDAGKPQDSTPLHIPAGKYSLHVRPTSDCSWTVTVNPGPKT